MSEHAVNVVTRWVVIGPFVLWLVWELVLLWMREKLGMDVRLISQEARSLAHRGMASLAYFLSGLMAHFFINWTRPTWDGLIAHVLGFSWWFVGALYLAADVAFPESRVFLRWPTFAALLGAVLAYVAFPQRALWTP